MPGDTENTSTDTTNDHIDLTVYRQLVKQFIDMVRRETKKPASKLSENPIALPASLLHCPFLGGKGVRAKWP